MENEIKKNVADGCSYKGEVEVGIYRNNKKYKMFSTNTGYSNLFRYLCDCLGGSLNPMYQVDIGDRPGKLQLLDNNGTRVLSYDITLTDVEIIDGSSGPTDTVPCSIVFDFLVPGTILYDKTVKTANLVSLTDSNKIYASTDFANGITVSDIDTNVYVAWKLTIGNR